MKSPLTILVTLAAAVSLAAAEPPPVYEKTPLPTGPLINRAPDFSQWQIAFSYAKSAKSAAGAAGAAGAPDAAAAPAGAEPTAKPHIPKEVTVTRTKPRWHAELVYQDGKKMESWCDGLMRYEVGPEPGMVMPIAEFNPGYNPAFLEYSTADFPDVDWVSPATYLGTLKDTPYWVFQQGEGGAMVWIDSTTRFPVRWQRAFETRVFKFLAPPTELLTLPGNVAKISEDLRRIRQLSNQVPPHR